VSIGAYDGPSTRATCPYCGFANCEADWVDVGVGMVQCGPYVCGCGASEVGSHDTNELDADEERTGWFKPAHFGTSANTFMGLHVDHRTAKELYHAGLPINQHREVGE
jgi:hypothetical protein